MAKQSSEDQYSGFQGGSSKASKNSDAGKRGSMKGAPAAAPLSSENDEGANKLRPSD